MPSLYCRNNQGQMKLVKRYFEASLDFLESEAVTIGKKTGRACVVIQAGRWIMRSKVLPGKLIVERRGATDFVVTNTYRLKKPKVKKMLVQEAPPV